MTQERFQELADDLAFKVASERGATVEDCSRKNGHSITYFLSDMAFVEIVVGEDGKVKHTLTPYS